jgi:two-component system LytT family sensor kinase
MSGRQHALNAVSRGRRWKLLGLVLGAWTVIGILSFGAATLLADQDAARVPGERRLLLQLGAVWIWAGLAPAVIALTRPTDLGAGGSARALAVHAAVGTGFVATSALLESLLARAIGLAPSLQIIRGPAGLRLQSGLLAYLVIVTVAETVRWRGVARSRQLQAAELQARLAKTELNTLKLQLHPHFMFNALNTVAELVHSDPEAADRVILRLGSLLRLSLDHAGHQVAPLRQEVEFLRAYLDVEQARFQDKLDVVWDIAPDTLDAGVPTLLWQPVLENAIRHGVAPMAGGARIVVRSAREGDELLLEIRDTGRGLPDARTRLREGVGLPNVRARLAQLYGAHARVALEAAPGGGTITSVRLPLSLCHAAHTPLPLPSQGTGESAV